ncbi:MAG TPA: amino acid adenylation domain-containing protein [Terriglobales bacterium]
MNSSLQSLVTFRAERQPESTAIAYGEKKLSYAELEQRSSQLARLLASAGCRKGDRIAFLIPKSPEAIVSMLGILKAGCIYVPLDTASPAARIAKILQSCECRCLLVSDPAHPALREATKNVQLKIGSMSAARPDTPGFDFCLGDLAAFSAEPVQPNTSPADPAHILFTSGSTGVPKGVVITHQNVLSFLDWAIPYFGIDSSDRNSGHSPLHFDLSTFDVYGTLGAGAELHLVKPELNVIPNKLAGFIRDSQLTQWFSVPSVLSYVAKFDVLNNDDFPALKRVLWCGETLPTPTLIYWMKKLPHVTFTNLYGPTEATIASSYYTVRECPRDELAPIPIGEPCGGEELLVLDEHLQPARENEPGDLYIRGAGLSPGYWRDEQKTRAAFVPNPADAADRLYKTGDLARRGPDGLFYYLGRADTQVKVRGYRVELGEIEAALHSLHLFHDSAIVAVCDDAFGSVKLCCAYVAHPEAPLAPTAAKQRLATLLPSYMIPALWHEWKAFPRTSNGKLDRKQLKLHFEALAAESAAAARQSA